MHQMLFKSGNIPLGFKNLFQMLNSVPFKGAICCKRKRPSKTAEGRTARVETSFAIWPNLPTCASPLQVWEDTTLPALPGAHPCRPTHKILETGYGIKHVFRCPLIQWRRKPKMQWMPHVLPPTLPARRALWQARTHLTMGEAESQLWSSEENTVPQRRSLSFTCENPMQMKCGQRDLHGLLNTLLKSMLLSALMLPGMVHFGSHIPTHGAQAHLGAITDSVQLLQKYYQATEFTGKTKTLQQLHNLKTDSQKLPLVTTNCLFSLL